MKKCNRRQIQADNRNRTPVTYVNTDDTWPAEWAGRVVLNGRDVSYDGVFIGIVYKVCAGWTGVAPDGKRQRALSRAEVIRRLLPAGATS